MLSGGVARSQGRGRKQLASRMGHVVWEGSIPRGPSEHSFHGLKMRDLDSQREEGIHVGGMARTEAQRQE